MTALADLYPELRQYGGLASMLQYEIATESSSLQVRGIDFAELEKIASDGKIISAPSELTSENGRWVRLNIAIEQKRYELDLGEEDSLPSYFVEADSLAMLLGLIREWVVHRTNFAEFKQSIVDVTALDLSNDGQLIRWYWKGYYRGAMNGTLVGTKLLAPLIAVLMNDPVISLLRPYTSHEILHLSRCTFFPFSEDCPCAYPLLSERLYNSGVTALKTQDVASAESILAEINRTFAGWLQVNQRGHRYDVLHADLPIIIDGDVLMVMQALIEKAYGARSVRNEQLGIGNADAVREMLLGVLPLNCGIAIRGTQEDLEA
jgi:hypothetical protein